MTNPPETVFFTQFRFDNFNKLKNEYSKSSKKTPIYNLDIFKKVADKQQSIKNYFDSIKEMIKIFCPFFEEDYTFSYEVSDYEFGGEKTSLTISQKFNLEKMKDFYLYFNWRKPPLGYQEIIEVGINKEHFTPRRLYSELFSQNYLRGNNFLDKINLIPKDKNTLINKLIEKIPKK